MRKNYFDEPDERKKPKSEAPRLFDSNFDPEVYLVCSKCQKHLIGWPVGIHYYPGEGEFVSDGEGGDRAHAIILRAIKNHPCLREKAAQDEAKKLEQIQARLDEIYAEPEQPKELPIFRLGQWVINVQSGALWQIEQQEDLDVLTEGYKNGQRNITPYE